MEDRTGYIGSSEVAALLGLSPFKSPLTLWAEKTGNIKPKDLSDNEAVEWGQRLEKIVAKKFAEKNKVKLIAYKKRFTHPKYSYLTCELDNIIAGTDEIVEIKTTSLWNNKEWEKPDDIPVYYVCQVMFALGLSDRKIGHIAVLIGGQKYLEKKIIFDKKLYDSMVKKAVDFWENFIVPKVMPAQITAKDDEILRQIFPNAAEGEAIKLDETANQLADTIKANQVDLMNLKDIISKNQNELKALLKENACGETERYRISWKNVHKDAYEVAEQNYRQLRITEKKENEK